jgi:hypothetical protein
MTTVPFSYEFIRALVNPGSTKDEQTDSPEVQVIRRLIHAHAGAVHERTMAVRTAPSPPGIEHRAVSELNGIRQFAQRWSHWCKRISHLTYLLNSLLFC